jgi:hypothetical protein
MCGLGWLSGLGLRRCLCLRSLHLASRLSLGGLPDTLRGSWLPESHWRIVPVLLPESPQLVQGAEGYGEALIDAGRPIRGNIQQALRQIPRGGQLLQGLQELAQT